MYSVGVDVEHVLEEKPRCFVLMLTILLLENCRWEKLLPSFAGCPTPRAAHGMCAVGSKLVIFGGRDSVGRKNDLFVLDTGESTDSS